MNINVNKVENKIPYTSCLVSTNVLSAKINEVENKFLIILSKITTLEFNKLTAEKFAERSNQANLVTKTDLDKKLTSFNRKTT